MIFRSALSFARRLAAGDKANSNSNSNTDTNTSPSSVGVHEQNIDHLMRRSGAEKRFGPAFRQQATELLKNAIIIPLPPYGQIQAPTPEGYCFEAVSALFERNKAKMVEFYNSISDAWNSKNLESISVEKPSDESLAPYWNNQYFPPGDARAFYAIAATYRPKKVIEMGVGHSTRFLRKAISDFDLPTRIISIDPAPRARISGVTDEHIQKSILDVDLALFDKLEPGDIFFIDGSHVSLPGTDVPHYMLNIFPRLKAGVLVHIHDIFLPWEYRPRMLLRQYNEQHMVAAMLLFSDRWDILLPVHYLHTEGILKQGGGSIWLRYRG